MVRDIGFFTWLQLFFAIILFLGPGVVLGTAFFQNRSLDLTNRMTLNACLAISFWVILFNLLRPISVALNAVSVLAISILAWVIVCVILLKRKQKPSFPHLFKRMDRVFLWGILLFSALIYLYTIRSQYAGLGSDSFHHTLIIELIKEGGMIPENYWLATDKLVSFSYHFGYHVVLAIISWLSGISPMLLVLLSGIGFIVLSALTVSFFVEKVFKGNGVVAAAIVAIIAIFPTYLLNWGRYTELAALSILPVLFTLLLMEDEQESLKLRFLAAGLTAAAVTLIHYRIAALALIGMLIYLGLYFLVNRRNLEVAYQLIFGLFAAGSIALVLVLPWIVHLLSIRKVGYPFFLFSNVDSNYYSIARIGTLALNYPSNYLVLGISALSVLASLFMKEWKVLWLFLWGSILYLLSMNHTTNGFLDLVTVVTSLYIPLAVLMDWGVSQLYQRIPWAWKSVLVVLGFGTVAFFGARIPGFVTPDDAYVRGDDIKAATWIQANTPTNAMFIVNLFNFNFSSDFIIGSDAGYWLPIIAERKSATIPMVYMVEHFRDPSTIAYLRDLNALGGNLTTPHALSLLQKEGITHVFIGARGGNIAPETLLASAHFTLLYHQHKDYVFQVNYEP